MRSSLAICLLPSHTHHCPGPHHAAALNPCLRPFLSSGAVFLQVSYPSVGRDECRISFLLLYIVRQRQLPSAGLGCASQMESCALGLRRARSHSLMANPHLTHQAGVPGRAGRAACTYTGGGVLSPTPTSRQRSAGSETPLRLSSPR